MSVSRRTDPHRPSVLEPADYEWVRSYPPLGSDPAGRSWVFVCAHCGHNPCLWGEVYRHKPTGDEIVVGRICAEHALDYPDRARAEGARARRAFENLRVRNANREQLQSDAPDIAAWFDEILSGAKAEDFDYVLHQVSIYESGRWPFNERLIAGLRRCMANSLRHEKEKESVAEQEAAGILHTFPEGRQTVEGDILSVKMQEGNFGPQLKMRVRLPGGNIAWGTVPGNLRERAGWDAEDPTGAPIEGLDLCGERVRFAARFGVSQKDAHFGYFSRPGPAKVIEIDMGVDDRRLRTSLLTGPPQLSATNVISPVAAPDEQLQLDGPDSGS